MQYWIRIKMKLKMFFNKIIVHLRKEELSMLFSSGV